VYKDNKQDVAAAATAAMLFTQVIDPHYISDFILHTQPGSGHSSFCIDPVCEDKLLLKLLHL
jgi:hypothetical protein